MKHKSDTVFITTVFPTAKFFLNDFFTSLRSQEYKDFDILIANDGIDNHYLRNFLQDLNVNIIKVENTPSKNREIIIKKALQMGYDYLIFGDADDYFSNNRIKATIELFQYYDIIVNDLEIVGNIKSNSFFLDYNEGLKSQNILLDYNIAGLSNTAIKSDLIKFSLNFPDDIVAADWLLFSQVAMLSNNKLYFTKKTKTYYRQYANNTAGLAGNISYERIKKVITIKKEHYKALIKFTEENILDNYNHLYKEKLDGMVNLEKELLNNSFQKFYINLINKHKDKIYKGWWSEAVSLEQLSKF